MDITTYVQFTTKFANGTIYEQVLPASGATITTVGDGSSGNFELSGASWTGSPSMSDYVVTINAPAVGVLGKLKLHKTVPSHYPCNLVEPGVSQELPGLPNIGWANAVPDSQATADFQVGDQLLKFYGYGYHDKNWGTRNLPNSVYSWYWGHLHIGPYSVVYFDILNSDLSEYTCGYLAKRARVLSKTCKKGLTVRPTGVNATFPPTGTSDEMTGFRLDFPTRYGHFWADLHGEFVWSPQLPRGGYTRFAGQITGGFKGQKTYTGAGVYEWIRWIE
ncbi:hypothetical protein EDB81DRAFT_889134 [Dactylonectria macrodidyma]|uniref:Uncharacterized protein n=1 Tax=Dactylonectria macrodidyma TaxID=307937 RepID=A0A9P9DXS4_9HYPO|nr:hypothetical protein EDB81DRAFT_889134 [Dactylonectria macrodidyma]